MKRSSAAMSSARESDGGLRRNSARWGYGGYRVKQVVGVWGLRGSNKWRGSEE